MGRYLVRRILSGLGSLALLLVMSFVLLRMFPGTPFGGQPNMSPATLALLNQKFHLDGGVGEQLVFYIKSVVTMDLGPSIAFPGQSVERAILDGAAVTFRLGACTLVVSLIAAALVVWIRFQFGFVTATRNFQWVLVSLPNLFVAPLVI